MKKTILIFLLTVIFLPSTLFAVEQEAVVLMPLRIKNIDKEMLASMETALVEGLKKKYKVYAGEQVQKKVREVYRKESARTEAGKECDATLCIQQVAVAFQTELIATANVTKRKGGYFLSLAIRNVLDDIAVYSKSMPCKDCDEFQVVNMLKFIAPRPAVSQSKSVGTGRNAEPQASSSGSALDALLSDVTSEDRENEAIKKRTEADISKYEAIVRARPEMKSAAWQALITQYPDAAGVREGDRPGFMVALGLKAPVPEGMVLIKGGCFKMGDTFGDGYSSEKPVHEVCLDDFQMGKYEVTQEEWTEVMGSNPSSFKGCDKCPVEQVSWNDVQDYIRKVNSKTGKNYRLPTEAEWEYAARSGGKKEKYSGGSDIGSVGWYSKNSNSKTHPVGEKRANGLGVYDMSGNVWEWVNDWYDDGYYKNSPKDSPKGPSGGKYRVLRGGSWGSGAGSTRASARFRSRPTARNGGSGFRLAVSSP